MRRYYLATSIALLIILATCTWLYLTRPRPVEMAGYVPASALVYIEANSLTAIGDGLLTRDAWRRAASAASSLPTGGIRFRWLSNLLYYTGLGPADAVVLSRAQVAITITGFEESRLSDGNLDVRPRIALIAETHTGERRLRYAVEQLLGGFLRRSGQAARFERVERDGVSYMVWVLPGERRRLVATAIGSMAVIGNDEASVDEILSVRRGERPSLRESPEMLRMRRSVTGSDSCVFGYVTSAGASSLFETVAHEYVRFVSTNPRAEGVAASLLPSFTRLLGDVGWSARFTEDGVEDLFHFSIRDQVTAGLVELPRAHTAAQISSLAALLPPETSAVTFYNYLEPESAWRAANAAIATELGSLSALLLSEIFRKIFRDNGIDAPEQLLRSIGHPLATARPGETDRGTVLLSRIRDEATIRRIVARRLGSPFGTERVDGVDLYISKNPERGAASIVDGILVAGPAAGVRKCLSARTGGRSLDRAEPFRSAAGFATSQAGADVITISDEKESALSFVQSIAGLLRKGSVAEDRPKRSLLPIRYSATLSTVTREGLNRRTRSAFGQFGAVAVYLSSAR